MKNLKYVLIMFVALTATIACSDDSDSDDANVNPIVGTWGISESDSGFSVSIEATFKENKTGTMVATVSFGGESETDNSSFTWSTSGDQLTLNMDGDTAVSTYSISGDKLTITDSDGDATVFTRQ
jgi:hypothetical protein